MSATAAIFWIAIRTAGSTFASLVDKIQERGYVAKENIKGKTITCTDFELEKLLEFKKYLSTQKTKPLPQTFTDEELIRTIIGCKFNYKKSLEAINSAIL